VHSLRSGTIRGLAESPPNAAAASLGRRYNNLRTRKWCQRLKAPEEGDTGRRHRGVGQSHLHRAGRQQAKRLADGLLLPGGGRKPMPTAIVSSVTKPCTAKPREIDDRCGNLYRGSDLPGRRMSLRLARAICAPRPRGLAGGSRHRRPSGQ